MIMVLSDKNKDPNSDSQKSCKKSGTTVYTGIPSCGEVNRRVPSMLEKVILNIARAHGVM